SAPSSPTSRSTARWSKRTTSPQRAPRPRRPRDDLPATRPGAKTGGLHDAATTLQGCARPAAGNRWEWPPDCATAPPGEAETPGANHRSEPQPALARPLPTRQTGSKGRWNLLCPKQYIMNWHDTHAHPYSYTFDTHPPRRG